MNNAATIIKVNAIKPHGNAEKLQLVSIFGTQVITDLSTKKGDLMIYFDSNLRLSHEYLKENNLYRHSELNKDKSKIGYFEETGKVKCIKIRGEFSDGVLMPISSLNFITNDKSKYPTSFGQGFEFNDFLGIKICEKYITTIKTPGLPHEKKNSRGKTPRSPMFVEHYDTKAFFKNQHIIPSGIIYIIEKTHGQSGRIGHLLVDVSHKKNWIQKICAKVAGIFKFYEYRYIHGSRRVVFEIPDKKYKHFHDPTTREQIFEKVKGLLEKGLLEKGQEIYFEIFGFETTGAAIQKGFSYGCVPKIRLGNTTDKQYRVKLYRMTMNNEDGKVLDYSLDSVIKKAEELGMEAPYIFEKYYYNGTPESMKVLEEKVVQYAQGQSVIDPNTLKEGVIVQFINNKGNWDCLKYKSQDFILRESKNKDLGIIDKEDIS